MSDAKTVTFYLNPKLLRQAEAGNHNFINQVSAVLTETGMDVAFDVNDELGRLQAMSRAGRSMVLMDDPVDDRGLTFRKTYLYPFWHIEKQSKRWDWPVAHDAFHATPENNAAAKAFHIRLRDKHFPGPTAQQGFVYMPLQGRLLTQRSFQYCSPIDMIKATLKYEPMREIIATLHPSEKYSESELGALRDLSETYDQLSVRTKGTEAYLRTCDYIVTQNSSLGFHGYFHEKPLVLFGKTDFHHIALNVHDMGVANAFAARPDHRPNYAAYLYWFLQERAINAGRPETPEVIRDVLRGHGWPV